MNDDELLQSLRAAVEASDPVPQEVIDVALRSHEWDTSLELLLITYDSATSDLASSGLRSTTSVRDITLSAGDVELELTISDGRIDGQVTPSDTTIKFVVPGQDSVSAAIDSTGRFTITTSAAAGAFVVASNDVSHRTELFIL